MSKFKKIRREMARIFEPLHWIRNAKFLTVLVISKFLRSSKFEDIQRLFVYCSSNTHLHALILFSPNGVRPDTKDLVKSVIKTKDNKLIVLSKAPLSKGDISFFKDHSIPFLEQQNTGLDFKSYRDVCMSLEKSGKHISNLTLMNDSFVYIKRLEKGFSNSAYSMAQDFGFSGLITQGRKHPKNIHVGSFFISFSAQVIQSPGFRDFWRNYHPSNNRDFTIRQGEIRLSQSLMEAGFLPKCVYNRDALIEAIKNQKPEKLDIVAEGLMLSEVMSEGDFIRFHNFSQLEKVKILARRIQNTENLRLSPAYSFLCSMPAIKIRNLRAYPGLQAWYETHLGIKLQYP